MHSAPTQQTNARSLSPALLQETATGRTPTPGHRARLVAVTSLSRGVGRTAVSRALARVFSEDGASAVVRLDDRERPGAYDLGDVPEYEAGCLPALLAGRVRPAFAVLDLPSHPCVAWARGLEVADDVLLLVQPARDDLGTLAAWHLDGLDKLRLVPARLDTTRPEDRRGLDRLEAYAKERLLDVALPEDSELSNEQGVLFLGPSPHWSREIRRLADWIRAI